MEKINSLGIFISEETFTAVLISGSGHTNSVICSFQMPINKDDQAESLAAINNKIKSLNIKFASSFAAIQCGDYNQYRIQSRFNNPKQIAQTVRFDAEEIMAVDIVEKSIAYSIDEIKEDSAALTLYSSDKTKLNQNLEIMQAINADPTTMEPDIICLGRFFRNNILNKIAAADTAMVIAADDKNCFFLLPCENKHIIAGRSFMISQTVDKASIISRQIMLSVASLSEKVKIGRIYLADFGGNINVAEMAEKCGYAIDKINLAEELSKVGITVDNKSAISFAAAYGSALQQTKTDRVDFRTDFAPYQGKKQIVEKTMKIFSISVSIILITLALFFQVKALQKANGVKKLDSIITADISQVIPKSRLNTKESVINLLKRELVKIRDQKSGKLTLESGSIEAKLNFVLEVINSTPPTTDLNIQTIDITSRTIRITGDTNSSNSTLKFFDSIKEHKQLTIDERFSKTSGNRNTFRVGITVKD